MTTLGDLLHVLCEQANWALQEDYDNSGLLVGDRSQPVTRVLVALDVNEAVIDEAVLNQCDVVVAHHPAVFKPVRQITADTATGRILLKAVRHNIALIAMHTNLDNHFLGVNHELANRLGLTGLRILSPLDGKFRKLSTYVPHEHAGHVRRAMHEAGAGKIGQYDSCSYNIDGYGTFRAGDQASPFVGEPGVVHAEPEMRIEVVYPQWIEREVVSALKKAHPYEEVAYDLVQLQNTLPDTGAGMIGVFEKPMPEEEFLALVKENLGAPMLRHTRLTGRLIGKVAVCGGSGSFLIGRASQAGADAFLTGDVKYHEFFDAPASILFVDAGHYETEQFTVQLLTRYITEKFPNFAVLISEVNTNPVNYF